MKKIFLVLAVIAIAVSACRKQEDTLSVAYSTSFPVVKITSDTFYTIQVGSPLPTTITASAYDTFYKKSLDSVVVIDLKGVDVNTPGFYTVVASARNQVGYTGYAYAYINVVANLSTLFNFTGRYMQQANGDTVFVMPKIAQNGDTIKGFYIINDVAGVHAYDSLNYIVPAFLVQQSNVQMMLPSQYSSLGTLVGMNSSCIVASADTAFQYQVINPNFGSSLRVFKKF
jgi:hypothetical protein